MRCHVQKTVANCFSVLHLLRSIRRLFQRQYTTRSLSPSSCHSSTTAMLFWWAYQPTCTTVCSQCSTLLRDPSPAYPLRPHYRHTRQFPLVEGPGAYSVQAGDNSLSFTERYSSSLPGCRPVPFVWHIVQTTSAIITHCSARCPPVAVLNSWRPCFHCGWCSTMEQSAL